MGPYVDLPANTIRYCFRTLADATMVRKCVGKASCHRRALIAVGHQVVLPARLSERGSGYNQINEFCAALTLCSRGHSLYHDGQWFHVYCFKEPSDAQKFLERFGGEKFESRERGRPALRRYGGSGS
jgi:hypothetical protein